MLNKPSIGKPNSLMLINMISRLFKNKLRIEAEKIGISSTYRPVIMILSYNDGITQLELVKAIKFSAPTISLTLQKMEQEGLVKRIVDEKDKRQIRVYITENGRLLDDKLKELISNIEKEVFTGLSKEELEKIESTLNKMVENLVRLEGNENEDI